MQKLRSFIEQMKHLSQKNSVKRLFSSIFTQSILSIANFIVGLSVLKFSTKDSYGSFIVLFSVISVVGNYQGSIINNPLTVIYNSKDLSEREDLVASLGYGQYLIYFPLIALSIILATCYCFYVRNYRILIDLCLLSVVMAMYLLREYVRTVNYINLRTNMLMITDIVFVTLISFGFGILIFLKRVNSHSAINLLGFGYFIAAIIGVYCDKGHYRFNFKSIKTAFRETLQYSSWASVGVTSSIAFNQGYIYIVSFLLGVGELAEISAARMLLGPLSLLVASSSRIVLAQGSDILSNKGIYKFKQFISFIITLYSMFWSAYVLALMVFYQYIISFLGDKYLNIKELILLWSIYTLISSTRFFVSNSLMVFKDFKILAAYDIFSAILTLTSCILLTRIMGNSGAIISSILGEIALIILSVRRYNKFVLMNA